MANREPVDSLKGIGEKTGKLFEKLGVFTVDDLLSYYPRAYDPYDEPVSIGQLREGEMGAVRAILQKPADLLRIGKMQMVSVSLKDLTGSLQAAWYNMPYMRANLKTGTPYVFRGRVARKRGRLVMEQPEVFGAEDYEALSGSMQPIYGQTRGLGNKAIVRAQREALKVRRMEREYMPGEIRRRYELSEINYAMEHIHFPADRAELLFARKRLVFDEFFMFLTGVRRLKEHRKDKPSSWVIRRSVRGSAFREGLPYGLTGAQERALEEIYKDLESGRVMNRLIQGDVGSGKTIIAVLALLETALSGYQGALMVPTEVLAKQHYESIKELF